MRVIKASEMNRVIAELLEPELIPIAWTGVSKGGAWEWSMKATGWQPLDFEHDPRGTVMLMESMGKGRNYLRMFDIVADALYSFDTPTDEDPRLMRAVALAFLKTHGIEVCD